MPVISAEFILLNIVVFFYFLLKDYLLGKIFTDKKTKVHSAIPILITLGGLYVYNDLQIQYNLSLQEKYIGGTLQLPPFIVLFVLADFLTSILLLFAALTRQGPSFFKRPHVRNGMEMLRLIVIYFAFLAIIGYFVATNGS